jgi:hypothetical protein
MIPLNNDENNATENEYQKIVDQVNNAGLVVNYGNDAKDYQHIVNQVNNGGSINNAGLIVDYGNDAKDYQHIVNQVNNGGETALATSFLQAQSNSNLPPVLSLSSYQDLVNEVNGVLMCCDGSTDCDLDSSLTHSVSISQALKKNHNIRPMTKNAANMIAYRPITSNANGDGEDDIYREWQLYAEEINAQGTPFKPSQACVSISSDSSTSVYDCDPMYR